MEQPQFNLLRELKNIYVNIILLQAIHDVPIYTKIVWDLCVRNPGRKTRDPLTVHVLGKISELTMGRTPLKKYNDPQNPLS